MKQYLGLLLILSLAINICLANVGGKRVLVLSDDITAQQSSHSQFFKSLTDKGYSLDFQNTDSKVQLQKYGDFLYDQLIIFSVANDPNLSSSDILQFVDGGNNVIIAGSSVISDTIRDVASECGIEIEDDKTAVFDNFENSEKSDQVISKNYLKDSPIIFKGLKNPILFKGIGHKIRDSTLNYALLTGTPTTFSGKVSTGAANKLQGKRVGLVSALQARNDARVLFSGSLDLFSDKSFSDSKYSSKEFVEQITSWTFQERGILRATELSIEKVCPTTNKTFVPSYFTQNDEIVYSLKIEEFVQGKWVPYEGTLQLEIICLDPYIRTFIKSNKAGVYQKQIKLPDVYGVFTFEGTVHNPGYGNVQSLIRHPIRPFRHDSYERFITSANPYYAASLSMMAGVFVFVIIFLLHKDPKKAL